jgi:CRISPR-associated protein Cas1
MYSRRFPDEDVSSLTMQQLRGREGTRIRRLYSGHSKRTGVEWIRREYRAGDPFAAGDDVNRLLSAAHSCLYGICHAAIVGIGASPGLGFVHTGGALSFVHDIADLYKAEYTIPLAFDLAANGHVEERDVRLAFRDKLVDGQLLHRIIKDVVDLLQVDPKVTDNTDEHSLWDERVGAVPGGINWETGNETPTRVTHEVITGPLLSEKDSTA